MTSIKWLIKEISEILGPIKTTPMQDMLLVDAIKKAKELHKQETKDAYVQGRKDNHLDYYPDKHAEEYYQETYEQ